MRPRTLVRGVIAVCAGLLLLEVGFRLLLVSPPGIVSDEEFQYFHRPGSLQLQSREGYSRSVANELGFLDAPIPPDDGQPRVLILGDSYVEAKQVGRRFRLARVADEALPEAHVMAAARSGWSPSDMAYFALTRIAPFDPDVLVFVYNGSDPQSCSGGGGIDLVRVEGSEPTLRVPRHRTEVSGLRRLAQQIRRGSALIPVVQQRWSQLTELERQRIDGRFRPQAAATAPSESPIDDWVADLEALHHMVVEITGLPVVYAYVPSLEYAVGDATVDQRDAYDAVLRLVERVDAPLVDPAEAMIAEYLRTKQPLHGFANSRIGEGHINAAGHRVAGLSMATVLREALP